MRRILHSSYIFQESTSWICRTCREASDQSHVDGRDTWLRRLHTVYLPHSATSKTKLLSESDKEGEAISFLQACGYAAEFLGRSTFLWAGCKDLKNSVYNGNAATTLNMSFH